MSDVDPHQARQFALQVVVRLREAGFEALWAGGCVRDSLLGREPADYDVATSATPEQVRDLFGRRRSVAVGEQFGVMIVVGPPQAGQVEVATFRRDAAYSDGRHPDAVSFSSAEEDAQRRDFTINGLFFDPLDERTIDYVGGEDDLRRGVVRGIGNPHDRLAEDKLRMLRAVRFAATFDFQLERETLAAVQQHADEIVQVSAERIAGEMRRMLAHRHRRGAVELLRLSGLLAVLLPELTEPLELNCSADALPESHRWPTLLRILDALGEVTFPTALAALLRDTAQSPTEASRTARRIGRRWKLSSDELQRSTWLVRHEATIRQAQQTAWPVVQRILVSPGADALVALAAAVAQGRDEPTESIDVCRKRLALPAAELNPPPLLTGDDLIAHGLTPGKQFKQLLDAVRDAQLTGQIATQNEALDLVDRLSR